jgi:hypothetical protein
MSDDPRDFIERTMDLVKSRHGREATPDEIAIELALFGPESRVATMNAIDADLAGMGDMTLGDASKFLEKREYITALRSMHSALQKTSR